eukprot:jgi/Mesvir1/16783/Mv15155-RA.1
MYGKRAITANRLTGPRPPLPVGDTPGRAYCGYRNAGKGVGSLKQCRGMGQLRRWGWYAVEDLERREHEGNPPLLHPPPPPPPPPYRSKKKGSSPRVLPPPARSNDTMVADRVAIERLIDGMKGMRVQPPPPPPPYRSKKKKSSAGAPTAPRRYNNDDVVANLADIERLADGMMDMRYGRFVTTDPRLRITKTYPPSTKVYLPSRMAGVDADITYSAPLIDRALGGVKFAFKRAAKGDGNCFYYSFYLGKAFQQGQQITQAQLKEKATRLRKELKTKLEKGAFKDVAYVSYADPDKIKNDLKGCEYATDDIIQMTAVHTKTDIITLGLLRGGAMPQLNVQPYWASGEFDSQQRSKNKPVYIWFDGLNHFESLIPESDLRTRARD